MARTKNKARKDGKRKGAGSPSPAGQTASSKKKSKPASKKAKLSHNANSSELAPRKAAHGAKPSVFLTEEELLACYYPLPKTPLPPPSQAFFARLHNELQSYNEAHVPTPAMQSARWNLINTVETHARQLWGPGVQVLPFGSFVTGLYLASSDIDLVVLNVHGGKKQVNSLLHALGNRLRISGVARDVTMIPSARVPLLKYVDVASGLDVDVSMGLEDGVKSGALMKQLSDRYPAFRPLTLFLKAFMQARDLADVFKGGISSYILQCMIIFHLQVQELIHGGGTGGNKTAAAVSTAATALSSQPTGASSAAPSAATLNPSSNLGYLLFTFFELFGYTFSYEEHGIRIGDVRNPASLDCYAKRSCPGRFNLQRPYLLSIEDPIQKERDIGGGCFGIRRVQRCFALAREFLCRMPQDTSAAATAANSAPAPAAAAAAAASDAASSFVIDTVGDPVSAASTSPAAVAAAASHAAAPASSTSAVAFTSSFGFLLSSLLSLPVRYSIEELQRAARKQPLWLPVVEKLQRIEKLKEKRQAKAARREARAEQSSSVAAKAQKKKIEDKPKPGKEQPLGSPTEKEASSSAKKLTKRAAAGGATAGAAATPTKHSIDLSSGGDGEEEVDVSSSEADDDDEDDDSDVEILEGARRRPKAVPIELLASDGDDDDNDAEGADGGEDQTNSRKSSPRPAAAASKAGGTADAKDGEEEIEGQSSGTESEVEMATTWAVERDALASAAAATGGSSSRPSSRASNSHSASAAAAEAAAEAAADKAAGVIDGDAMLAAGEHDESMMLNLK